MTPNNPELSNCCQAPIKATHGCDDDFLHGGKKCTCEIVTSWYECEKCKQPCDRFVPKCTQICECVGKGLPICEDCRPHVEGVKLAIKLAEARRSEPPKHWWWEDDFWSTCSGLQMDSDLDVEILKAFIRKVERAAYERGRLSAL